MFKLGGGVSPDFHVVEPRAEASLHVEARLGHPLRKDTAGNLLGNPLGEGPLVDPLARGCNHLLHGFPLSLDLPWGHGQGVLPILQVLGAGFPRHHDGGCLCVPLTELLEAEAAVPQELPSNVPRSYDLQGDIDHLQGGPMLIPMR